MIKRLNITLPEDLAKLLEKYPNKSKLITEALREKFEKVEKEKLVRELQEGYIATRSENNKVNEEWRETTLEKWNK
jgi:metal-responsive CopG/Arc/MetJ family transcriptional regulator